MALESGTSGEYATWLLALTGVWTLVSPVVYAEDLAGAGLHNTNGVVVTALAGFVAYSIRA